MRKARPATTITQITESPRTLVCVLLPSTATLTSLQRHTIETNKRSRCGLPVKFLFDATPRGSTVLHTQFRGLKQQVYRSRQFSRLLLWHQKAAVTVLDRQRYARHACRDHG